MINHKKPLKVGTPMEQLSLYQVEKQVEYDGVEMGVRDLKC